MKIVDFINFYNTNIINPYIKLLPSVRQKLMILKNSLKYKDATKNEKKNSKI